ncbi:M1 family metallopeptidase [Flavobacterium silvaticum]|uniref:Aminopeptidase N n=1 Tax=Flavobacterium silvaticum TaxID=1852020 RepID=A0A972JK82_9FLAO|nr:M1 family aminopeptidase [Flavobacterium silvaticum]NMH28872.1 M1 family peptidase [Flavobacterium silvaticum]
MKYLLLLCFTFCFAQKSASDKKQQIDFVDFKSVHANLSFHFQKQEVSGDVTFEFEVKKNPDTISIDAVSMEIPDVTLNGKISPFINSGKKIKLYKGYKKGKNTLVFHYSAHPKQALYFVSAPNNNIQIWTQGQGKYTSNWFPSFDDANEKLIFSLSLTYASDYTVISNGQLNKSREFNGQKIWDYSMDDPMSSYLLMLAIGKFDKKTITADSGTTSELYLEPTEMADKWEPTYRYSKQIFDFLEKETIPYAWKMYRQIPVRDFLYGGMENTSSTLFTRDYVVDSIGFNDRNYVNVNGHELAHQWFGDLVTAKSGEHHWLQEGFATYYALLAEREVFGDDYFYWKLYENAETIQQASKTDTIPILNAKASSTTYYQKGAWALHILRETVGEDNFRKAVRNYLDKYKFTNVDTKEFLDEVYKVKSFDRDRFEKTWLKSGKFEVAEALQSLSKNQFMRDYFELGSLADKPFADKKNRFMDVLHSDAYYPIKQEVIYQSIEIPFEEKKELLRAAMATKDVEVRQVVAQTLKKIPAEFQSEYESLLTDASYITREITLNALCREFPEKRSFYLDQTDGQIGLNDKNIRLLWLTLALKTEGYRPDKKAAYYDELLANAQPGEEGSVRQSAMQKLLFIDKGDSNVLPLLAKALVHQKWQLTKFARDTIREKLKLTNTRKFYEELLPSLSADEQVQLKRLLDEK